MGPKNHVVNGVKIGRIHSPPQGVTSGRYGFLPSYYGHLFTLLFTSFLRIESVNEGLDDMQNGIARQAANAPVMYLSHVTVRFDVWSNGTAFARDPKGRGFESRPVRFQVTALGKLLTRMCIYHQAV